MHFCRKMVELMVAVSLFLSHSAVADDASTAGRCRTPPSWELGVHIGFGVGWAVTGDAKSSASSESSALSSTEETEGPYLESPVWSDPSFAAGGYLFADYLIARFAALTLEVGILSRGYKKDLSSEPDEELDAYLRFWYLSIPVGATFHLQSFRIGIAVSFEVGLWARSRLKGNFVDERSEVIEDVWDTARRFNLGPRVLFGYAVSVGDVRVIPSVTWSMHVLDDLPDERYVPTRFMNVMVNLGVAYHLF